jgi:transcription elongation factor GreA
MKIMITSEGLAKLREDLNTLKTKEMKEALLALSEARDKGDISENAEYEVAKENLNMLGIKIKELEEKIKNCVVVKRGNINSNSVQLFTTVKLLNIKTNKDMTLSIVTDDEIDVANGKVSQNSPIAQGLIGKTKGDKAKINVPAGILEFEIMDITCV